MKMSYNFTWAGDQGRSWTRSLNFSEPRPFRRSEMKWTGTCWTTDQQSVCWGHHVCRSYNWSNPWSREGAGEAPLQSSL